MKRVAFMATFARLRRRSRRRPGCTAEVGPAVVDRRGGRGLLPRTLYDEESFGCITNIELGDYRLIPAGDAEPAAWWRLENYGVFHCALLLSEADAQSNLRSGFRDYAWVIVLDEVSTPTGDLELLALQIGARTGSSYRLLSRLKGVAPRGRFSLLDPECPRGATRQRELDIWRTDYCLVADQRTLRRIARAAFRRPPLGVLEFVGDGPDDETSEGE